MLLKQEHAGWENPNPGNAGKVETPLKSNGITIMWKETASNSDITLIVFTKSTIQIDSMIGNNVSRAATMSKVYSFMKCMQCAKN